MYFTLQVVITYLVKMPLRNGLSKYCRKNEKRRLTANLFFDLDHESFASFGRALTHTLSMSSWWPDQI
jgi:hypothetical protein